MRQPRVTDYFHRLTELMLAIEVTNIIGASLSVDEGAEKAVRMFENVRSASRKVMLAGNGGSAAIVSHAQNDLSASAAVRAMVFTEQPLLTATANDHGYGSVFEQPINLWAEPGDLLLTVSSSGKSENIIRALQAARDKDCKIITLSGFSHDNASRQMGDLNFYVPSDVYAYVESVHTALIHFLTTGLSSRRKASQQPGGRRSRVQGA